MGNRAYITLENKTERKSFYTHWNGGPDTWYSLAYYLKSQGITSLDTVDALFETVAGRKLEPMEVSLSDTEENGHYYLNLEKQKLVHIVPSYNKSTGLYDISSKVIVDHRRAFDTYIESYMRPEFVDQKKTTYWDGMHKELDTVFKKIEPKKAELNPMLEAWKKESPYQLAPKEKTYLKRKLKELEKSLNNIEIKASMRGDHTIVNVTIHSQDFGDLEKTQREFDFYNFYTKENAPVFVDNKKTSNIEKQIDEIILPHQTVYSESDPYTDYHGVKRLSYYYVEFELSEAAKTEFRELIEDRKKLELVE